MERTGHRTTIKRTSTRPIPTLRRRRQPRAWSQSTHSPTRTVRLRRRSQTAAMGTTSLRQLARECLSSSPTITAASLLLRSRWTKWSRRGSCNLSTSVHCSRERRHMVTLATWVASLILITNQGLIRTMRCEACVSLPPCSMPNNNIRFRAKTKAIHSFRLQTRAPPAIPLPKGPPPSTTRPRRVQASSMDSKMLPTRMKQSRCTRSICRTCNRE